ncbi:MAG: hydrogenase formation protein HypD [Anaerolineae bacterium]|jgi:hydrogenase expression/formation protein HypD
MKYVDEFRDPGLARKLLAHIENRSTRTVRLMEFCGGHTHAIMRYGLRTLLPDTADLRSGPGCPVCVTANADLDRAIALAQVPDLILTTFGDMVRVPGSTQSLQDAKADGADVRMVYSTLDALRIARENPEHPVVFLGVGFETTAPTIAAAILKASAEGLENFSVLSLHKLTPPATRAILDSGEIALDGIIGPGHVTTIIGTDAWEFLPAEYNVPVAVAGFEPLDILRSVADLIGMIEDGQPGVANTYARSVSRQGNPAAMGVMGQVFKVSAAEWRGLGMVPASGLAIRPEFVRFDAAHRFAVDPGPTKEHKGCLCGDVLRGTVSPPQCPLFGKGCTPARPIGPCMVSAEGACAAHYQFGRELL